MCRIVGRISKVPDDFSEGLKTMMRAVAHGGPDDEGSYVDGGVSLGHRRLSIIDLTKAGHQPMLNDVADIVISYNGEIYNFKELREELKQAGCTFRTQTDTEVILLGYKTWGVALFDRLEGIFAFALYDKVKHKLLLVRDHFGVKPLYYSHSETELIFSSEVRAFKALREDWSENPDWRILFLAFGSIPRPFTTLDNVLQLTPGSYLEMDTESHEVRILPYRPEAKDDFQIGEVSDALRLMDRQLNKAFQKNLVSDAPLGIFLSGGIDSSLLTLLADRLGGDVRTISVNFDEASFDESAFQELVLERTSHVRHRSYRVNEQNFWENLDDIWKAMDQPSVDAVNAYFVTKYAQREGVKVVLSGLGADEIFGGYASFDRIKWIRRFRKFPWKSVLGRLLSLIRKSWGRVEFLTLEGPIGDYLFLRGIFGPMEISRLLGVDVSTVWQALSRVKLVAPAELSDMEYASFLETNIYMKNQLLKDTDYMGMWHGVEVRVPFLDIALVKSVEGIDPSVRYRPNWPKFLITASCGNILPHDIVFREKRGFTFPMEVWMRGSTERFRKLLPDSEAADEVYDDFQQNRCHWSKCWSLAVLKQVG